MIIANREYVETPTYRWNARLKRRVVSGVCLRRRWAKVRGKAAVKQAKRARARTRV